MYSLTELRKFVAAFCSCTAFHPFGHRLTICFLLIFSITRWVTLRAILWFLWLRPFSVVLLFLAGEAQSGREISESPEDLRVVAVLPGFYLVWICLELWNQGVS